MAPTTHIKPKKRGPFPALLHAFRNLCIWVWGIFTSSIILSILFFIVVNFYIFSSVINIESFFYIFLVLSVLTDGLFILIHLPRKHHPHPEQSFDPSKLTILIICYNGEDVIGETIRQAATHVPLKQIIVVSDASTDNTAALARQAGVRVLQNRRNVNKAFSINTAIHQVHTPYTLILDDDTMIENTFLPTSLLDEGFTAVAFNVMPEVEDSIINALQMFEYRKSMQIGKSLRSRVGAIGNVSGAIGLFHTHDLVAQSRNHSGQFGGEDEQRTALAHLYGKGKGITYTNSTVITKAPNTLYKLLKQRSFSWNLSVPELFVINWRILLHPKQHYLLKAEKAYQMYVYLTDPLRMLFFWILFTQPTRIFASYGFYLFITFLVWLKTGHKDKIWVIFAFPLYSLMVSMCRFVSHFYWVLVKFRYFVKEKFHRLVPDRWLFAEFMIVLSVMIFLWTTSIMHFNSDLQLLTKIQNNRIDTFDTTSLDYESKSMETPTPTAGSASDVQQVIISRAPSDNAESLADKALVMYSVQKSMQRIEPERRRAIASYLAKLLPTDTTRSQAGSVGVSIALVEQALREAPRV